MPIVIFDLPLCIFYFCYYSNCSFLTDTNNTKHIDNTKTAKSCCYTFQALIVLVLYVKLQNNITCNVALDILAQLRYIMTNFYNIFPYLFMIIHSKRISTSNEFLLQSRCVNYTFWWRLHFQMKEIWILNVRGNNLLLKSSIIKLHASNHPYLILTNGINLYPVICY